MNRDPYFATLAVRAGQEPDPVTGAIATPIYQTTNFAVKSVDEGAARCIDPEAGYIYSRLWNPTQKALEEKVAALEGGEAALAAASGMAAITAVFMEVLRAGDHVVCDHTVYSATHDFLAEILTRFGVEVTFTDTGDPGLLERAVRPGTRVIYFETPANPTLKVVDLEQVASLARPRGITTVVDGTFASPALQRPLRHGIDVVVHSATKYLGGHGDVQGGVVVGAKDLVTRVRQGPLKNMGGIIDPFAAWLILRGIQTLPLRMEKHCANALAVARYLEGHPAVAKVHYPGLPSHPQHAVATRQMSAFGGVVAFEVTGGLAAGRKLLEGVRLCHLAVSLGDTGTLIEHAASMTHTTVGREARLAAGITDGLIRLSVGLEDHRDIIADLEQALSHLPELSR